MLHKLDLSFCEQYKITSRKDNCTPTTITRAKPNGHIHIRKNLVHPIHRTRSRTRTIRKGKRVNPWHLFQHARKAESVQACTKITFVCTIIISGHCTPSAANVAKSPTCAAQVGNRCHVLPVSTDVGAGQNTTCT
jgi:hypothetical protein